MDSLDTLMQNRFQLFYYSPVSSLQSHSGQSGHSGHTHAEPFPIVLLFTSLQSPVSSHILDILDSLRAYGFFYFPSVLSVQSVLSVPFSPPTAKDHGQQRTIRTARIASTGCLLFSPAFAGPARRGTHFGHLSRSFWTPAPIRPMFCPCGLPASG